MSSYTKDTAITFITRVITLILGIVTSITIARLLGPENKGIYTMAALLPQLIVTIADLGIGPATVYYVAQRQYPWDEILGNNILLAAGIGCFGVVTGLIIALFFQQNLFPGVPREYLILAVALIPVRILFSNTYHIILGAQRFKEFNLISLLRAFSFLVFLLINIWVLNISVIGALSAGIASWILVDVIVLFLSRTVADGISLKMNITYIKKAATYGIQAHISNILGFLNYRIDMFLVNSYLNPRAVGFYSIGVGLVEKLWLVSHAASTVIFPKVAAETNENRRKSFTPLVARTVLWITLLGSLILLFLSRWIVLLFYSEVFLPSVRPLQILLPGILFLSVTRVLANDVAGRGKPIFNTYVGIITLTTNVILNLVWIPKYGIAGAALASTVSYGAALITELFFYTRLTGNSLFMIIFFQKGDWALYWKAGKAFFNWKKRDKNKSFE